MLLTSSSSSSSPMSLLFSLLRGFVHSGFGIYSFPIPMEYSTVISYMLPIYRSLPFFMQNWNDIALCVFFLLSVEKEWKVKRARTTERTAGQCTAGNRHTHSNKCNVDFGSSIRCLYHFFSICIVILSCKLQIECKFYWIITFCECLLFVLLTLASHAQTAIIWVGQIYFH